MGILDRYREVPPRDSELSSVIENLRHVLNSKAGFHPIRDDFGLSDVGAIRDRTAALHTLAQEILDNIRRYEPRLTVESLTTQGRGPDFWLRLELRARLSGRPQRLLIRFNQIYATCDVRALHVE